MADPRSLCWFGLFLRPLADPDDALVYDRRLGLRLARLATVVGKASEAGHGLRIRSCSLHGADFLWVVPVALADLEHPLGLALREQCARNGSAGGSDYLISRRNIIPFRRTAHPAASRLETG